MKGEKLSVMPCGCCRNFYYDDKAKHKGHCEYGEGINDMLDSDDNINCKGAEVRQNCDCNGCDEPKKERDWMLESKYGRD